MILPPKPTLDSTVYSLRAFDGFQNSDRRAGPSFLLVSRNVQANPDDYEDADWDTCYALYSKYMTQFSPIAHELQCPDG